MKNKVQEGNVLTVTAPYAVASGAGCLVAGIFGVATMDIANAAQGEIQRSGVFDLAKTSAQAWTAGARIYWDNTNKECTTTAADNTFIGVATEAAANPSAEGRVALVPVGEVLAAAIASLTDNSGGSANGTVEACGTAVTGVDGTGSNAASKADVDARLAAIANNFADLAAKVNAILAHLRAAGGRIATT